MSARRDRTVEERSEDLAVLACELDKRPKEAPSFSDLEAAIREVRREGGSLVIGFDPAESERVAALVDAERQCCPDIGWELQCSPALRLRISATPAQLDVFAGFLAR